MNFEIDNILQPMGGNNADARVSSLRVMNDLTPTPQQLAELQREFNLHRMALRTGIVGHLTKNGKLSDGSPFRIVSNSGMHQLMIWPAPTPIVEEVPPLRVFCIPANTDVQFGWKKPAVEGENGTPATAGTADAGVTFTLERKTEHDPFEAKHLKRYQTALQPATKNVALFADGEDNNTSAQYWENREWISKDRKVCVTTVDGIRINGVRIMSLGPGLLWACLHKFDPGDGVKTFLVIAMMSGRYLEIQRAPLHSFSFTTIGSIDLQTLDAAAISDSSNGFADLTTWIGKVAHNESQTVLSVWVQNPNAETLSGQFSPPDFFVGVVDFNMETGEVIASTPAAGESVVSVRDGYSGTYTVSGVRQIGFAYEADEKVFTELHFSGSFTQTAAYVTGDTDHMSPEGVPALGTFAWHRSATDNREVKLVRGNFSRTIAAGTIVVDTEDQEGYYYYSGAPEYTQNDYAYAGTFLGAQILYQSGGPMMEVFTSNNEVSETGTIITDSLTAFIGTTESPVKELDLGSNEGTSTDQARWGTSLTSFTISGDVREPMFSTFTSNSWGCANRGQMALVKMPWLMYFASTTSIDDNSFNGRWLDKFAIVSVPKLKADEARGACVLDPTSYETYCTDTKILEKINAGGANSVLKGISFR